MIDTIKARIPIDFIDLHGWVEDEKKLPRGQWITFHSRTLGSAYLEARGPRGGPPNELWLEASLPRVVRGDNGWMASETDLRLACTKLDALIAAEVGSFPPLQSWSISRLDLYFDWNVVDPSAYVLELNHLANIRKGTRRSIQGRSATKGATFCYWTKGWKARMYDKSAEMSAKGTVARSTQTHGRLRYEVELRLEEIKALLVNRNPSLEDALSYVRDHPHEELARRWTALIPSWGSTGTSGTCSLLLQRYSQSKAATLYGYFLAIRDLGVDRFRTDLCSDRSRWKRIHDGLTQAGVRLGTNLSLPPLSIP